MKEIDVEKVVSELQQYLRTRVTRDLILDVMSFKGLSFTARELLVVVNAFGKPVGIRTIRVILQDLEAAKKISVDRNKYPFQYSRIDL